ncbi:MULTISPECIES: smalltalk protein [Bacteroides]|nr:MULTISPECIES: smalltalk protein [Bacteroides]MBS7574117.1 smalltalk protein [Bacteroides propionicigenes]
MKVSVWDKILKVIIAVASAIAGVIGGQVIGI